jgi:hypothetical protein
MAREGYTLSAHMETLLPGQATYRIAATRTNQYGRIKLPVTVEVNGT